MKRLLLSIVSMCMALSIYAQERKSVTMPYKDGTLSFQYYEKDGVKVPDGSMEFIKGKYTEKGEMKDGYREGLWIATITNKTNKTVAEYNYSKGMLEGQTSFTFTTTNKDLLEYNQPYESYNFHNGRLIGENKIVLFHDTIYCNFADEGKRIGIWKIKKPDETIVIEYNDDPSLNVAYKLDILGQKEPMSLPLTEVDLFQKFRFFKDKFQEVFFKTWDKQRPELPTLCENKYGYVDAWVIDGKEDY